MCVYWAASQLFLHATRTVKNIVLSSGLNLPVACCLYFQGLRYDITDLDQKGRKTFGCRQDANQCPKTVKHMSIIIMIIFVIAKLLQIIPNIEGA